VAQQRLAARRRHGAQKGAGFDAVGHHVVRAAAQRLDAADADAARAVAFDLRAHGDQHLGQVGDFGLLRGVFEHRLALGQRRGHEQVLGAGHRDHVRGDARAVQPLVARLQFGDDVAMLDHDVRAHGLQALDVLIDGARAYGAAARQRHRGFAKAREQRAQREHRGAHGLDQVVRRLGRDRPCGVKAHAATCAVRFGAHAHVVEQPAHGGHVLQARHVEQVHGLGREQRRAHLGQGGVLRAGDGHFTLQTPPAADQEFVHANCKKYE